MMKIFRRDNKRKPRDVCAEKPTGKPGDVLLRERLNNGMPMGAQLRALVDQAPGEVTALVLRPAEPEWTGDLASDSAIRYGCKNACREESLSCLLKPMQDFLIADPDHVCIIEDAVVRRQNGGLSTNPSPALLLDDNVYWFLSTNHRHDPMKIVRTLRMLNYWGTVGIWTRWPHRMTVNDRQEITPDILRQLVIKTERVIVNAYDGRGYLIWYREGWPIRQQAERRYDPTQLPLWS